MKQIEKYYPGNYGAPGKKRGPKQKRTPEDIARQNQRNREKKVQRIILANFKEGDWHLIIQTMDLEYIHNQQEEHRFHLWL